MRKTKRYDEGGETNSDYDEETQARGTAELEKIRDAQPSFKEAFASARANGDKTFEWNGKKYTTEMAKPKAAAPAAEAPAKLKYQSLQDRAKSYEDARAKSGVGMYGTTKSEPKEERKALPLKSTKSESGNKFMGSTGLKAGGSVSASRRADGIASKGKTKGRMV